MRTTVWEIGCNRTGCTTDPVEAVTEARAVTEATNAGWLCTDDADWCRPHRPDGARAPAWR